MLPCAGLLASSGLRSLLVEERDRVESREVVGSETEAHRRRASEKAMAVAVTERCKGSGLEVRSVEMEVGREEMPSGGEKELLPSRDRFQLPARCTSPEYSSMVPFF